eukprot:6210839-Pleurochrysis_carterae.AAC.3
MSSDVLAICALCAQTLLMQRPLVHAPADPSNQREWGRPISELAEAFGMHHRRSEEVLCNALV